MNRVEDIINLKTRLNLLEEDATYEKQLSWYRHACDSGLVETLYKDDELLGFLEWVRVNAIPKNMRNIPLNFETIKTAPILLVCNACAIEEGVLHKLRMIVINKNKDAEFFCWYRKKNNIIKVYKNIRRKI